MGTSTTTACETPKHSNIWARTCLGIVVVLLFFPDEAGGAVPDSVDGAGRPQSTRVTQLGALMSKFSSESLKLRVGQVVSSGQDARWARRLIVTGGMQNILPEDGVDFDGDTPIMAESFCTVTAESLEVGEGAASDAWERAPSMSMGRRCLHTTCLLGNRVLVIGGHNGHTCLATVEAFDPASSSWTRTVPSMRTMRNALASAELHGRVYAIGGSTLAFGNPSCTVESWAEGERAWRKEPSMPQKRMRHAAVALGGRLYVLGGHDGERFLDSVLSYDPESKEWREEARMSQEKFACAAAVSGGRIYVSGGYVGPKDHDEHGLVAHRLDTVESFDPAEGKWREEPRMIDARSGHVAVGTDEGRVVVAGGCLDGCGERTASVEVLDCGSGDGWAKGAPMLMERFGFGAAMLPNY